MSHAVAFANVTETPSHFPRDVVLSENSLRGFAAVAQRALVLLRADGIAIALRTDQRVTCYVTAGELAPSVGTPVNEDSGLASECMRTRRTLLCSDSTRDARVNRSAASAGVGSVLVAPLNQGELVLGVIEAMSSKVEIFGEPDQRVLESIACELLALIEPSSLETSRFTPAPSSRSTAEAPIAELPSFLTSTDTVNDHKRLKWAIPIAVMASAISVVAISLHNRHDDFLKPLPEGTVITQTYLDSVRKSAQAGNVGAQSVLGTFYWTGRGIAQDNVSAYMWSAIAAAQGDANSKQRLELLRNSMTAESIDAGERRAHDWLKRHPHSVVQR